MIETYALAISLELKTNEIYPSYPMLYSKHSIDKYPNPLGTKSIGSQNGSLLLSWSFIFFYFNKKLRNLPLTDCRPIKCTFGTPLQRFQICSWKLQLAICKFLLTQDSRQQLSFGHLKMRSLFSTLIWWSFSRLKWFHNDRNFCIKFQPLPQSIDSFPLPLN